MFSRRLKFSKSSLCGSTIAIHDLLTSLGRANNFHNPVHSWLDNVQMNTVTDFGAHIKGMIDSWHNVLFVRYTLLLQGCCKVCDMTSLEQSILSACILVYWRILNLFTQLKWSCHKVSMKPCCRRENTGGGTEVHIQI